MPARDGTDEITTSPEFSSGSDDTLALERAVLALSQSQTRLEALEARERLARLEAQAVPPAPEPQRHHAPLTRLGARFDLLAEGLTPARRTNLEALRARLDRAAREGRLVLAEP